MKRYLALLIVMFTTFTFNHAMAQCNAGVPTFNVNLTGNPDSVWASPFVVRNDNCCGTSNPDKCVQFIVTLDPLAAGISFNIIGGAVPPGALFYQINCGPPQVMGEPICLSGVGPHVITFCKPGNNDNIYEITSIPAAVGGSDITINDGCTSSIEANGFNPSTVTWTSIAPGNQGAYDNYLSCTSGCLNPTVTPVGTAPSFIDYMVCGQPLANCNFATVCDTIRVNFNPTLSVSIQPNNPTICFGQTSTTITAVGSGGTPPYSYLWNNVNPSQSNIVGAGTYTVMLSDASGCPPVYATITVTAYTNPIVANAGNDITVCNQSPTTTLNGSVSGASGGIWSGGQGVFSPNDSTLVGVTYTPTQNELNNGFVDLILTSTGNGTCPSDADTIRINYVGFTGTINTTITNISCFGANDGTASINITGGFPLHTYNWNTVPVQTGANISGLSPGVYNVTIEDSIGCTTLDTITITEPSPLVLGTTTTPVSCPSGNDGTATVSATGGTPPYSYLWLTGGQTTSSITGQIAGTYSVEVTDANGCSDTATVIITEPSPISISFSSTNVSCFGGNDGSATATIVGGSSPYAYNWLPNGGTNNMATGLTAGTYSLTVTDANGCTFVDSVTIVEPPQLVATTSVTNVSCNGLSDGTATVLASGGTAPYTYLWNPSGGSNTTATGLSAGNYNVQVTDANGCQVIVFATITEPLPLALTTNQINVSCFGGNDGVASVGVTGGTIPYTYSWNPNGSTTNTANNLSVGNQTVTVTDSNGCQTQTTLTITEPTVLSASTTSTPASCFGASDGSLSVIANGGTAPYSYLWLPNGQTTSTITGQLAGNYSVTVTDSLGCSQTILDTILEPTPIVINFNSTNVSCYGGSDGTATAIVTGGTAPYTYSWSPIGGAGATATGLPVGNYSVTITDANGCTFSNTITITQPTTLFSSITSTDETCPTLNDGTATVIASGGTAPYTYSWLPTGGTNATATNLAAGNYTITVTDNNGCQLTTNVVINEPNPLTLSTFTQDVSCFGGSDGFASVTPSGGTPNYTYLWSPSGSTSNLASNLSAGTHNVTVTDNNGCQTQTTVTINQPTPISVSFSTVSSTCFGASDGSITANVSGGSGSYAYSWLPTNQNVPTITNVAAGDYIVNITDTNGCFFSDTVSLSEPSEIVLNAGAINSTCGLANGLAFVSIDSGGVAPFTYLWSPVGGTSDTASGLFSGAYTVLVTDANGCTATATGNVNDIAAPVISFATSVNVSCKGGADGSASVSLVGGTGPFTYLWSPTGATTSAVNNLPVGTYTVTVTGSNGCSSNATTIITEPTEITPNVTTTPVSCYGGNDGTANITAYGGTPGYNFTWLPQNVNGSSINGLSAGIDSVKVTDANGCEVFFNYTITEPTSPLTANLSSTPVSCFGGNDGTALAIASGGTAPYSYNWMPGNYSGSNVSNLPQGTYTVTIVDANGCVFTDSITVTEPTAINLVTSSINANCGQADGQAHVVATGGVGNYSYLWMPTGGANDTAFSLLAGNYQVTVTDSNGCIVTAMETVNDTPPPTAIIASTTDVTCFGGSNGSATVAASGGTLPYTYQWSPIGGTGNVATNLPSGIYTVVVTDANGCQSLPVSTPQITQPNPIIASFNITNVSCFGGNDGGATVNVNGGVAPYSFFWFTSGATTQTVNGLSAGQDSVRVTDVNGCSVVAIFTINEPTQLTSSVSNVTNVSCFSGANGAASILVSGGTLLYNYQWLPTGGSSSSANGLSAGNYTVNISDNNGCTTSQNITITQPSQALTATATTAPNSCFGSANGTATAFPSGGTPGYAFSWSPIGGANATATGLPVGNYTVTVTDTNGCIANTSVAITQPPALQGTLAVTHPSCNLPNGSIVSQISGGIAPYNYLWTPTSATTANLNSLSAGTYSLQVTDVNNCILNLSTTLTAIPAPIVSINNSTPPSCYNGNDGTATVIVNAGSPPYAINWTPYGGTSLQATGLIAGTYHVTVTDSLGCVVVDSVVISQPTQVTVSSSSITAVSCNGGNNGEITVQGGGGTPGYSYSWTPTLPSTPTVSNLTAGTYVATVTDQNNCSASISVTISEPTILTAAIGTSTDPTCSTSSDGTATAVVTGGTVPYNYSWTPSGQTGSVATNLSAGNYSVLVTDANGCTSTTIVTINQPTPIVTIAGQNDTICVGQQATVTATASGGSGNYSFGWQPVGLTNSGSITVNPIINTDYTVVAFDQNGCPGNVDTVSVIVQQLLTNDIELTVTDTFICPGEDVVLYTQLNSTATGPLTYTWNNSVGNGPGPFIVIPTQPTTYIVTVANPCGITVQDSVIVNFSPPPTLDFGSDVDTSCAPAHVQFYDNSIPGDPNDFISSWLWDFGDGNTSTDQNPAHVFNQPGTYNVILNVTTSNGCSNTSGSSSLIIQVHPVPTAAFTLNATQFYLPSDKLIATNQSTGAVSYEWSFGDGGTSNDVNPEYLYYLIGYFQVQLIATNQYGCKDTAVIDVVTDADVVFPNAFTPTEGGGNGGYYGIEDLSNDVFFPYTSGVVEFKFEIFNRWGELVFVSNDIKQGWDGHYKGKLAQQGVYIWKAYLKLNNGKEFNKAGDVTLLR
ncbi:MAG: PKD domain-containing protein [Vicingaceae bacterium]|nr:PKD domain-containing protein [Vicingaceae bacterium]